MLNALHMNLKAFARKENAIPTDQSQIATSRLLSFHNQSNADEVDLDNVLGSFWDHFGTLYVWNTICSTQLQLP